MNILSRINPFATPALRRSTDDMLVEDRSIALQRVANAKGKLAMLRDDLIEAEATLYLAQMDVRRIDAAIDALQQAHLVEV